VEQLALEEAGILHADHHAGEQQFERARRREIEGGTDLAQVSHGGVGVLRAGDAEACDQTLRVIQIMIAHPGERQISKRDVLLGQVIEGNGVGSGGDRALAGQHHALRLTGGAGSVEDDRGIGALAGGDLGVEPGAQREIIGQRAAAVLNDLIDRAHAAVVVVAQAAPLVVDHLLKLGQALLHGEDLIDLFLVLDRGKAHLGMREHEGELLSHRVGIYRHRHGAEHLRRHHRPVELGPVGADDGDGLAALEAEAGQAGGQATHDLELLGPGPGLPDAEILLPHGRPRAEHFSVTDQQLRKCIRLRGGSGRHD